MIFMGQNGESGVVNAKRYPPTGTPENTDCSYTTRKCAAFWEVRRITRAGGKVTADQLVAVWPTEQEAEAMARDLADPKFARGRGRRILEDLVEGE